MPGSSSCDDHRDDKDAREDKRSMLEATLCKCQQHVLLINLRPNWIKFHCKLEEMVTCDVAFIVAPCFAVREVNRMQDLPPNCHLYYCATVLPTEHPSTRRLLRHVY